MSEAYRASRKVGEHTGAVTAKTATPTKVDSKLSDAHLESLER
jgi:hypothetical protein